MWFDGSGDILSLDWLLLMAHDGRVGLGWEWCVVGSGVFLDVSY